MTLIVSSIDFAEGRCEHYRAIFGQVEFREIETSFLSCINIFLKSKNVHCKLSRLLELAPISKNNLDYDIVNYCCRKIGISLLRIDHSDDHFLEYSTHPTLIVRKSGYSLLILESNMKFCIAVCPGRPETVLVLSKNSEFFDNILFAAKMCHRILPVKKKPCPKIRLFLLPWQVDYLTTYDDKAGMDLNFRMLRVLVNQNVLRPLARLSISDLLTSHLSLAPNSPELYGVWREIELKRNSVFIKSSAVKEAVDKLIGLAGIHNPLIDSEINPFATRLFVDFLTIHPFNNGNRRMAMELVTVYLFRFGLKINWSNITTSEIYYWTRCAARGHLRGLERIFFLNTASHLSGHLE